MYPFWEQSEKHSFSDCPRVTSDQACEPRHVAGYLFNDIIEYFQTTRKTVPIIVTMYYWGHGDTLITTKDLAGHRWLTVYDNSSVLNPGVDTLRAHALYEVSIVLDRVTNLIDRPTPPDNEYYEMKLEDGSKAALLMSCDNQMSLQLLDPKNQILDCRLIEIIDDRVL
jgi:hypothetical protein